MTELAIDEPDATIVTDFAYDQTNTEQKSWKFCNDVTVPRSEVVFYVSNDFNFHITYFLHL